MSEVQLLFALNAQIFSSLASQWKALQIGIRALFVQQEPGSFWWNMVFRDHQVGDVGGFFLMDWIIGSRSLQ